MLSQRSLLKIKKKKKLKKKLMSLRGWKRMTILICIKYGLFLYLAGIRDLLVRVRRKIRNLSLKFLLTTSSWSLQIGLTKTIGLWTNTKRESISSERPTKNLKNWERLSKDNMLITMHIQIGLKMKSRAWKDYEPTVKIFITWENTTQDLKQTT